MAHFRKPLALALALNTAVVVTEAIAGIAAQSLSLVMDSIHNLSDELALVFLLLAYTLPMRFSRNLVRSANLLNSVGLVTVSALLAWQAIERMLHPVPVWGLPPIVVGLAAAAANAGVALLLKAPGQYNPAIRLAYLHNQGDVLVSLAPVVAGVLVVLFGLSWFDPLIALIVAAWIVVSMVREVIGSREELVWPENVTCDHSGDEAPRV